MGRKARELTHPRKEQERDREEQRKQRRAKKRRGKLRLLMRLGLAAVAVLCVVGLFANWREISPDGFVAWMEDVLSGTTGGSWPVTIGEEVNDMQEVGSNMVVLDGTATVFYNGDGGESVRRTYAYAEPLFRANGRYALLLEKGGNRYRLESRSFIESEKTVEGKIYTGCVGSKGDVAVVTGSSKSYVSDVTVYSRKGDKRYQWLSAEWMVMDVSFSSDGNALAVVGCRSQNGAMQSVILVFDLRRQDQQPIQYITDDTLYTRVNYTPGGTVTAVGDNGLRFVNPTGSLDVTVSYDGQELIGYAFGGSETAIVTRSYGAQESGTLTLYSSSGDAVSRADYEGAFRDVAAAEGGFLLLTDRFVYQSGGDGFARRAAVSADAFMVGAIDGKPLILGLTKLEPIVWE
ncbi:MAG: hypothetical protein IJB27_06085 [Clostridia bacterium]|nr:hypothetical protein [Clostridia bacterium]